MNVIENTLPRLHRLKKIEVVVLSEDRALVEEIFHAAGLAGWTMIRDVAGLGHGGFHQGKSIFNDQTGLVMFVAVARPVAVATAVRALARLFTARPGVTFLSEVEVIRSDYFAGEPPAEGQAALAENRQTGDLA